MLPGRRPQLPLGFSRSTWVTVPGLLTPDCPFLLRLRKPFTAPSSTLSIEPMLIASDGSASLFNWRANSGPSLRNCPVWAST